MMQRQHIFVVDGDAVSLRLTCSTLEEEGYWTTGIATGEKALAWLINHDPDLVILEIALPTMDGFEICQRIREVSPVPIIILTSRVSKHNEVIALDLGADDYITKPFAVEQMLARVKALLRRARLSETPLELKIIKVGDLQIDVRTRQVTLRGREVALTPTEYRLLRSLADQPGTLLSHDHLLELAWGASYRGRPEILRTSLWRLRRKLEDDPARPRYIISKPGQGYMLSATF